MHTALVFRGRLLESSETFIVEQARALRRYSPVLAGLRRTACRLHHLLPEIVMRSGSGALDKIAVRAFLQAPLTPGFFRRLRAVNPSILHAHFATDAAQALPIADALDLPLIVSLHGYDVTSSDADLAATFSGRYYLARRNRLFTRASAFICVSRSIREAALRAGFPEEKLHVHYTGVDCDRFQPLNVGRDPKLVLFVGRLVETKGCEYVLRAMALVQKQDPMAHLEVIGDGPLRPALETLAKQLALRIRFLGVQDTDQVRHRMSRARVLCNPSVTAEGFGMVFAEAQSVGTPVVSCMHSAIPEAVKHGETGLLCPERAPGPLAEALLTFLKDDIFWQQASAHSIARVRKHFDIASQTVKLEQLYDDCREEYSGSATTESTQPRLTMTSPHELCH
jgi:glycosyltransferase involved in cell wall biosynthesis